LEAEAPEAVAAAGKGVDNWGIGALSAWDSEGRVRFDRQNPGESTLPYDADPAEACASLCAGNPVKLNMGHKRSPGIIRAFREALSTAGQDLTVYERTHKSLHAAAEARPRELVRMDRPFPGVLAAFGRFSPEVGELSGCGLVCLTVFEPGSQPLGSPLNVAMLYASAPNSRTHRLLSPATFLCALRSIGSNIARTVREYNRTAGAQAAPESWERTMWWEVDLRAQVEYYLSDRNLLTDAFFRDRILAEEEGWLDMELLKGCQGITLQAELLGALSASKYVETKVTEDGRVFVRRMGCRPVPMKENTLTTKMKRKYAEWRRGSSDDPTCWDYATRGVCPRGEACRYVHLGPPKAGAVPPPEKPRVLDMQAVAAPDLAKGLDTAELAAPSEEPQPPVESTPEFAAGSAGNVHETGEPTKAAELIADASPCSSAVAQADGQISSENMRPFPEVNGADGTEDLAKRRRLDESVEAPDSARLAAEEEKWRKRALRFGSSTAVASTPSNENANLAAPPVTPAESVIAEPTKRRN